MSESVQKTRSGAEIRKLVEQAQQGDRSALEELYLIHFDRIYSYLHMTVGNRHDAEDLTTQTFLRMLESIGKFRFQSAPFSAWLFRIAHNLSMDHFRANRRWQPEEDVPEPHGYEERSAEDSAAPSGSGTSSSGCQRRDARKWSIARLCAIRKSHAENGADRQRKRPIASSIFRKVCVVRSSASCRLPTLMWR